MQNKSLVRCPMKELSKTMLEMVVEHLYRNKLHLSSIVENGKMTCVAERSMSCRSVVLLMKNKRNQMPYSKADLIRIKI